MRRAGATTEDEARFIALQHTDERQQAEINGLVRRADAVDKDVKAIDDDTGQLRYQLYNENGMFSGLNLRVAQLETAVTALESSQVPRSDLYRRLTSRKFLAAVFTSLGAVVAALAGVIPAEVAATISAVIAAVWIAIEGFVDAGAEKARAEVAKAVATLRPPS